MEALFITFLFVLGTIFGSFFNVVGLRLPKKQTITTDRSHCPNCQSQLSWYELIPIISYFIQAGKCRHCRTNISINYPIVELITGILFAYCYVMIGMNIELVKALLFISMSIIVVITDMRYMIIPNNVLLFFLPLFIIMNVLSPLDPWWSAITGAIIGGAIIFIIILLSRGGMGAGDMKLFFVLGLVLGMKSTILALFLASIFGAVIGSVLLLLKIIRRKQPVPFGPFIILGALLAYFYGESIIEWYWNIL